MAKVLRLYYYRARYYSHHLGRFLSRDLLGHIDSMGLYLYVNNNPMNYVDSNGKYLRVSAENSTCTLVLTLNITIYAQDEDTKLKMKWTYLELTIKDAIESYWNAGNWTLGFCSIKFEANIKSDKISTTYVGADDDNEIQITTEKGYRSYVTFSDSGGTWAQDDNPWVFAHEAGHLMGLGDDYTDKWVTATQKSSVPDPGHSGHMMAEYGAQVQEHEVKQILNVWKVKCPCTCPPQNQPAPQSQPQKTP